MSKGKNIFISGNLTEAVDGTDGLRWKAVLLQEGESANNTFYSPDVLRSSVELFNGIQCYADHNGGSEKSVRDIVGWFEKPVYESIDGKGCITAEFNILGSESWFRDKVSEAWTRGKRDLIGFSILGNGKKRFSKSADGHIFQEVQTIESLVSVDAVARPSAGGRFLHPIQEEINMENLKDMTIEELRALRPDLVEEMIDIAKATKEDLMKLRPDLFADAAPAAPAATAPVANAAPKAPPPFMAKPEDEEEVPAEDEEKKPPFAKAAPEQVTVSRSELEQIKKSLEALTTANQNAANEQAMSEAIAKSGLPAAFQTNLRKNFSGKNYDATRLAEAIKDNREALNASAPPSLPNLFEGRVTMGMNEQDKVVKAMDGMFERRDIDGIPRFHNLRHAYSYVTGKPIFDVNAQDILRDSAGPYDSGIKESITSTSWPNILGTTINRQMLAEYRTEAYNEWRKVATVERLTDMKAQERLRLGGYGELSTVAEGQDYADLVTPTEQMQSYTPALRGGLESITLQAIANDDLNQIRRVPKALARAAKVTLYRRVFAVFTTNGNMLYDTTALFHNNHGNLATAGLSDAALTAAVIAMKELMVPVGTATTAIEYIDNTPKTLVVPLELERTAWDLVNNEVMVLGSDYNATQKNPHYGKYDILVVRHWTDADNWYLVCDPNQVPTIEVGFYGSEEPELFTEAANTGKNFTADLLRYKVRHIYGVSAVDHRGMHANIVG